MASDDSGAREEVSRALAAINSAWLEGRAADLAPHLHPDIVMALPGLGRRVTGKDAFLSSFEDFIQSAKVLSFDLLDRTVDVSGPVAVASFAYAMLYERQGGTYRATGRDLWVFRDVEGRWLAVWRTMLEVAESEAS